MGRSRSQVMDSTSVVPTSTSSRQNDGTCDGKVADSGGSDRCSSTSLEPDQVSLNSIIEHKMSENIDAGKVSESRCQEMDLENTSSVTTAEIDNRVEVKHANEKVEAKARPLSNGGNTDQSDIVSETMDQDTVVDGIKEEALNVDTDTGISNNDSTTEPTGKSVVFAKVEGLEPIVKVENGWKSYGSHSVLENLNISVGQQSIYALLGASGCGKTTLLSCIVGIKNLDRGDIRFCGEDLKQIVASGGLRQRVGYMPQELALYKEFTIKEALMYFGRIYQMRESVILKQANFLVEFLQLPHWDTEIRQMSGGQQRRTSFAVALLHSPKLLILDEPTVGVDALLRRSIWEHLKNLVLNQGTTVIITTHYIEEASSADMVGLMRSGRILAEGSPNTLLEEHNSSSLEVLFLKLSQMDEIEKTKLVKPNMSTEDLQVVVKSKPGNKTPSRRRAKNYRGNLIFPYPGYFSRLYALIMKNFVYISRQLLFIFFLLLFPAIQVLLCCWAIGGEPWGIPFGIVNYEELNSNYSCLNHIELSSPDSCNKSGIPSMIGCDYIENLSKLPTFELKNYKSTKAAGDAFEMGTIYGYLLIPKNFTQLVLTSKGRHDSSLLNVQVDMTSRHISLSIQRALGETLQNTAKSITARCNFKPNSTSVESGPIKYEKPLYGHTDQSILIEYVAPGLVLGVIFFAAISVTGLSYVVEKKEGMLERSIVAGVSTSEVITAQLLSQCAIVIIQTAICLVVVFLIFNVPNRGPLAGVIAITILQGFLGMFSGFVLSSVCDEEKVVMQWSVAITLPMVVLAGIFWPISGMPTVLKYFAWICVPQTLASESMRSMLARGWGILHPNVWPGFAITIGYSIALWIIATIFAKRSVSPKN